MFFLILIIQLTFTNQVILSTELSGIMKCPLGTFRCGNVTIFCIEQQFICDGTVHCDNGEDEERCVNRGGPGNSYRSINLHINKTIYEKCDLSNFPPGCACKNSNRLYCDDLQLNQVPSNINGTMKSLVLKNNSITSLTKHVFESYGSLRMFYLENQPIKEIEPCTFHSLKVLHTLHLNGNQLRTLSLSSLSGLENLVWLNLIGNQLEDFDLNVFTNTPKLKKLKIDYNKLKLVGLVFPHLRFLTTLDLDHNEIEVVTEEMFQDLPQLISLHLGENRIQKIHVRAFYNLHNLHDLELHNNQIRSLNGDTFKHSTNLTTLLLKRNPITDLRNTFQHLSSLMTLNVEDIDIEDISTSMFSHMKNLNYTRFKRFHYCSYAPHVRVCTPKTDGLSSMENLLDNPLLRYSVWVVASLTCLGNAMVLFGRLASREDNRVLSIYIRNLSAADFLMGIYLFVIGGHDQTYREHYNEEANEWMSSWRCTISGIMAMISSETSVMIICFMTVERWVCIARPFKAQMLTRKSALKGMASLWLTGFLLALMPIIYWSHSSEFYGSNGMCFPLHISDPFDFGWQYSALIFLGVNGICVALITLGYVGMFVNIKRTRRATTLMVAEKEFAVRFFFIVFTDCLCWVPIIVLKLIVLLPILNFQIPDNWCAWVVVFILPINSAINPFLYTFTTRDFRKHIHEWACSFVVIVRKTFLYREDSTASCGRRNGLCFVSNGYNSSNSDMTSPVTPFDCAVQQLSIHSASCEESGMSILGKERGNGIQDESVV